MHKRIVYEDCAGCCRIINPNPGFQQEWETDDEAIYRLYVCALRDVTEFFVCTPDKIPSDKTFREAWKKGTVDEPIKIDLVKSMEIHRSRIQEAAERKLGQLNAKLEIAIENDNLPEQVAIRRTKKILRTIHECDMSHCKTPEDVKYFILPELHDVWTLYPPRRP